MLIQNLLPQDFIQKYIEKYLNPKINSLNANKNFNEPISQSLSNKKFVFYGKISKVNQKDVEIKFSFRNTRRKDIFDEHITVGASGYWNNPSNSCKINSIKKIKSSYIVNAIIHSTVTLGEFGYFTVGGDFLELYIFQRNTLQQYLTMSNPIPSKGDISDYQTIFGITDSKRKEDDEDKLIDDTISFSGLNFDLLKEPIQRTKKFINQQKNNDPNTKMKLDEYQYFALDSLNKFINNNNKESDYRLVWGPPGTGKTQLISRLCAENYKDKKILITSFTNVAVDNALERIVKNINSLNGEIVRLGSVNKVSPQMRDFMTELTRTTQICGCTLDYAMKNLINQEFDLIIIDEASMVALPKILFTFLIAKKVILIGDFFQLHPFDDFKDIEKNNPDKEILNEMKELASFSYFSFLCLYWLREQNRNEFTQIKLFPLVTNRRSYIGLVKYANEKLYQGLMDFDKKNIKHPISFTKGRFKPLLEEIFFNDEDLPILIIPSNFHHSIESYHVRRKFGYSRSGSYGNLGQIAITLQLIKQIIKNSFQNIFVPKDKAFDEGILYIKQIGIISIFNFHIQIIKQWLWKYGDSFYNADEMRLLGSNQETKKLIQTINDLLSHYYKKWIVDNLEVGTVEKFQGKEKDVILTNTVFNPRKIDPEIQIALRDPKKLNVILTRARYFHIIISNSYIDYKNKIEKNLYTEFFNGLWRPNEKFLINVFPKASNSKNVMSLKNLNDTFNHKNHIEGLLEKKPWSHVNRDKNPFEPNSELPIIVKEITGGIITIGRNGALEIESQPFDESEPGEEAYDNNITNVYYKSFIKKSVINREEIESIILENIINECYSYFEKDIARDPKFIYDFGKFLLTCLLDQDIIILLKGQITSDLDTLKLRLAYRIKEIYEQNK